MTINDWLEATTNRLTTSGIKSARLDALILLEHVQKVPRESLIAQPQFELGNESIVELRNLVDRRAKHEPIAYLTGHKEFYGLDFEVDKNVLVPRPETEMMVEYIIGSTQPKDMVLDVGTGSGAIAVALKKLSPGLEVSASEISHSALAVARKNATKHDVFIGFVESDLFDNIGSHKKFDVVAANLPYVQLDKIAVHPSLKHEPALALFPDDSRGLSIYERFFRSVNNFVKDGGYVIIEHDPDQREDIFKLGKLARFNGESISPFITKFSRIQRTTISIK